MKKLAAVAALLLACGHALPASYVRAQNAAEQAYAARQFSAAGAAWLRAAAAAKMPLDRNEARYRAATCYERGGDLKRATELYQALANGKSERAPRATFALADLQITHGDAQAGYAALEAAIRKYPTSGVAGVSLTRYFASLADSGGDQAVLDYVDRVEPSLDASELAEQYLYERARRLDALGRTSDALAAYLRVAERFPYPHGAYWDDALFRAAACDERQGDPRAAVALLERLLRARETSRLSGSYEHARFADAAYHIAELYRDALHEPSAARRAFRAVFTDYPSSTLRDDALWQEALLARRAADADGACAPLTLLVRELPDSRYAACASEICARLQPQAGRTCRGYIERELVTGMTQEKQKVEE